MGLFDNKLYNFLMLLLTAYVIVQIMNFFDIEYVFYLSYLLWFIAVGLFIIFLPKKNESIF